LCRGPVLEGIGVAHRPAHPLDQLAGEMVGFEVGADDSLAVDDLAIALRGVGDDQYLGHWDPPPLGAPDTIVAEPCPQVKTR
jgi:hypothetical protein